MCQHRSDFANITITQEKSWANINQRGMIVQLYETLALDYLISQGI